jgi:hypothetical protein
MVKTRAGELTEFNTLLRRAAYLRKIDGDKRDAEIIIDDFIHLLELPSLLPLTETLRGIVQRLAVKVGAIENDPTASAL